MTDESIHALVHCGTHGQHERIADLKCQARGRKVSVRFGTTLYRLKSASSRIAMVMTALAEGIGVAAAAHIFAQQYQPYISAGEPMDVSGQFSASTGN